MSKSIVVPKTCALKLKISGIESEKKFKNFMLKIHGVEEIEVDRKKGQVIIIGTVEPETLISKLREVGIKAELLWEKNPNEKNETSLQIVQSQPIQSIQDRNMVEQLLELSGIEGLEEVQVTHTTSIKLTFKDKIVELSKEDGPCSEKIVMDVHRRRGENDVETHSKCCCGHVMNGSNHEGCDHHHGPPWFCPMHNQNNYGAYGHGPPPPYTYHPPPPPPTPNYEPTAPPEPVDYQYNNYTRYHSPFSDENPNSCTLM